MSFQTDSYSPLKVTIEIHTAASRSVDKDYILNAPQSVGAETNLSIRPNNQTASLPPLAYTLPGITPASQTITPNNQQFVTPSTNNDANLQNFDARTNTHYDVLQVDPFTCAFSSTSPLFL